MKRQLTPLLALLTLVGACYEPPEEGPPAGYERGDGACTDGRDNDLDGRIDCMDLDCVADGQCGELVPLVPVHETEDTLGRCRDGIDNDDDGQFDCGDRGCQQLMELCCVSEFSDATCSDGIDNDGNGFADCADFVCRNNAFVTVCDNEGSCDNGEDDDGDGFTDCDDRDCEDLAVCTGAEVACSDGIDNDGDTLADCDDPDCFAAVGCEPPMGAEDTVANCQDDFDNDGDGFVDCMDFDCSRSEDPAVLAVCDAGGTEPEDTLEKCMDGIDNDGNSFVDCNDFSCSMSLVAEIAEYCAGLAEVTFEACTDGEDNDNNGFVDCNDFSCSQSEDPAVRAICEANYDSCKDGLDNDGDGFSDCADYSCRDDSAASIPSGGTRVEHPCRESFTLTDPEEDVLRARAEAVERCSDTVDGRPNDNDADGAPNCEDWDCHWNPLLNPDACAAASSHPACSPTYLSMFPVPFCTDPARDTEMNRANRSYAPGLLCI